MINGLFFRKKKTLNFGLEKQEFSEFQVKKK